MPKATDVEIQFGVVHPEDVIDLPCKVENEVLVDYQALHHITVSDIVDYNIHFPLNAIKVIHVSEILRQQRVQNGHLRPKCHKPMCEITADETQSSCNQHAGPMIIGRIIIH